VVTFATRARLPEEPLIPSDCKTSQGEETKIMKTTKLVMLVMTIAVALFILIPNLSWAADDGATIYKAKCAMCHGADAAGKPAAKIPSLVSDDLKKASDDDLAKDITEKAKHPATVKSLAPDQVKMVVSYIRSLQK
jgi:mono/diheme cytochrome c family protein